MSRGHEVAAAEVKALMLKEIESMRKSTSTASQARAGTRGPLDRALGMSMGVLNNNWQLGTSTVRSSRRIIGPVLNLLRKIGYWATRPYLLALAANQTQFNSHVTQALNQVVPAVDKVQSEVNSLAGLQSLVEQQQQRIEALTHQLEALEGLRQRVEALEGLSRRVEALEGLSQRVEALEGLSQRVEALEGLSQRVEALEAAHSRDDDASEALESRYLEMQMCYRGATTAIREHQSRYVEFFRSCTRVLDVGCGRGEFLSLLKDEGVGAYGIDLNKDMVKYSSDQGVEVYQAEAIEHLQSLPDNSLDGIFASHVTEHLPVDMLHQFLVEAFRTLKPGAKLVFETPNVASPVVLTMTFYRDWTHCPPVHPETVRKLVTMVGFQISEVLHSAPLGDREALLSPIDETLPAGPTLNENFRILNSLVFGHQNYAVVAVKSA